MGIQSLRWAFCGMFGSIALVGCALPSIHRDSERERAGDAGVSAAGRMAARTSAADAGSDAGANDAASGESGEDSGTPLDPMMDPANRNEDFRTFQSLVPSHHIYAEWPMPDRSPGAPVSPDYSATDRVVIDNVTKLRWQRVLPEVYEGCAARYPLRGELQGVGTGCSWEEAKAYCRRPELEEELGTGPWRLPTKIELESLVDLTAMPAFDPLFETYPTDFFWSASPFPNPDGLKLAWAVDFSEGYSYASGRYKGGRVRCVSSPDEMGGGQPDYGVTGTTVEDRRTGLVWQRLPDSGARTWEQAIEYCAQLALEGGGWRLPFLKELLTIVDASRHLPAVVPSAFTHTQSARFWTASRLAGGEDLAFQVDFAKGGVTYTSTEDEHFVHCVRR